MKVIAVISAKGGVGKTTVCANLAVALSDLGQAVMAVDLDPQNALRLHLGVMPEEHVGMAAVEGRYDDLRPACLELPSRVVMLPYGDVSEPEREAFEARLAAEPDWLLNELKKLQLAEDAIVIIDTPPGPSVYLRQALSAANLALVVTLADAASFATIPLIESLVATYAASRPDFVGHAYAINQVNRTRQLAKDVILTMQGMLGERVVAMLHQDTSVGEALAYHKTVVEYDPHCQATADFMHTARWVVETFEL